MFDDNTKTPASSGPVPGPEKLGAVTPEVQKKDEPSTPEKTEIHTMPMEYYLGNKTVSATNSNKPINIKKGTANVGGTGTPQVPTAKNPASKGKMNLIIVVVLVVVLGVSGFLLYKSFDKPVVQTNGDQPVVVAPEPQVKPIVEEPIIEEPIIEEPEVVEEPVVTEVAKFNPDSISQFSLKLLSGPDKDNDKLTDAEEVIFGTNENLVDTDGDVYKDQEEIMNFYSPTQNTSVRLWEEDCVDYYTNKVYGYKILYPTTWLVQPLDQNNPNDLMISSNQNEFINIFVYDKLPGQSLDNWYLGMAPSVLISQLKHYQTYNKLDVVESPDSFSVYIESPDKKRVYALNYNIGLKEEANFPNIFALVVNSFQFEQLDTVETPSNVDLVIPALDDDTAPPVEF